MQRILPSLRAIGPFPVTRDNYLARYLRQQGDEFAECCGKSKLLPHWGYYVNLTNYVKTRTGAVLFRLKS